MTKHYCNRCECELSYVRNTASLHVYHDELRGKSYSLTVSMGTINPTNGDCSDHFCEQCVLAMTQKAIIKKAAECPV